jgi:predicted TIM-barrel fold metal-dependent hydrolase
MSNLAGRIIDAHVHVWTPDTDAYPLHSSYKKEDMKPPSFTAEELFSHCKRSGVERINLIQMSFYRQDHSYMLAMMEKYPDNFAGTGVLPDVLDDDAQDPSEMMVELGAKRCYAFRVRGGYRRTDVEQPNWMSHPKWDAMFETGAEHNLALSFLMNPGDMPEVGRMCAKHPDTPVIIDHLARIGANEPVKDEQVDELCGLAKHRNIQIKVGAFYALGDAAAPYTDLLPMIERVVDAYGPDRCMWESDCPFQVDPPHKYDDSVALIRDHADFLSPSDKEKILVTTAEKFFFDRG